MFKREHLSSLEGHTSFFAMSWLDFEYACKYLLEESREYAHIAVTGKGPKGGDRGIDLQMKNANGVVVAYGQCKSWKKRYKNLLDSIYVLAGCMMRDGIKKGFFVITTDVTDYEKDEARKCGIEVIDASALDRIIRMRNVRQVFSVSQTEEMMAKKREGLKYVLKAIAGIVAFACLIGILIVSWPVILGFLVLIITLTSKPGPSRRRYRHYKRYRRRGYPRYPYYRRRRGYPF